MWSAAPTRLTLGVDDAVLLGRGTGAIGMLALYRSLYDGTLPPILGTLRHPWRSYLAQAELTDTRYQPVQPYPGRDWRSYTLTLRDGGG